MNGVNHPSESIHVFHVGKMRIKLCKGKTTIAKEYFSTSMQVLDHFISYVRVSNIRMWIYPIA